MKKIINNRILSYLSKLILPKQTDLIITDLNKVVYSTNNLNEKAIDDSLLLYLVRKNQDNFNILEDKTLQYNQEIHYILPLIDKKNTFFGTLIFVCQNINKTSKRLFKSIKHNIEFLSENYKPEEIQRIESNPIYNSSHLIKISKIIDDSINRLYCDKNYNHIVELLTFKIDSLRNNLEPENKKLLDEIYDLLDEQKIYYGIYAFTIGNVYKELL